MISFNSTQTVEAIWPFVTKDAATYINPVNWRTDDTPASFAFRGTFKDAGVSRDNMHHWDLLFYMDMIHDNAVKRAGMK